jgi:hypothetical protein
MSLISEERCSYQNGTVHDFSTQHRDEFVQSQQECPGIVLPRKPHTRRDIPVRDRPNAAALALCRPVSRAVSRVASICRGFFPCSAN